VHADTQGQSTTVFGLAYLFNIKLMPRIRNFKDLKFFRPDKAITYKHINNLFDDEIDWELIETHWQDLIQVALSIKYGKISSTVLLRKLTNYSRKSRLFSAFQELGHAIRTIYLLDYISNPKLRENITASTNKVEAYNGLSDWTLFGSNVIVASNDEKDMEKAIKYNTIVTNSIILQNLVDISQIIYQLKAEGRVITKEEVSKLSPYLTEHIKRFGNYVIDLKPVTPIPDRIRDVAI
jgi:TnpA family transposase